MPKQSIKLTPKLEEIKEKIITQITDLLDNHLAGSVNVVDESESKKGKITFAATIDLSESVGHVATTSSYSQVVKDTRASDLEDISQPRLNGMEKGPNAKDVEVETPEKPFNPAFVDEAEPKKRGRKSVDNAAA